MKDRIERIVDRTCGRWVEAVSRHVGAVVTTTLLVTVLMGAYAALNLGVDTDPRKLINPDLPFQVRQRDVTAAFRTISDGFLVVIDAESPFAAGEAADALAARLAERRDVFAQVYVPGGGPFYAKNGLLYLEPEQLDDLTDRLSRVQPFLAELARDQSIAGIASLLRDALVAERTGESLGIDLPTALARVSAAVEAAAEGRAAADPWGSELLGDSLPAEARQRVIALRADLDYGSFLNAGPGIAAIRTAQSELGLTPENGFRVRITGEPVLNDEELHSVRAQAMAVAVASFVLFTAAVSYALRSVRTVLALAGSLLVSLIWSNAFAAVALGHLNTISAAFNVLIIGLGGEFGIHVCMRYGELIAAGRSRTRAIIETAETIGSSLVSSACTTSIGLYIFLFTDFTGVAQLGLISGTGVILSLVSSLTVLPAILSLGAAAPAPRSPTPPPWVARLEHLPLRFARGIRITAIVIGVGAAALLPRVNFDHNLLNLRDSSTESVRTFEDLLSRPGSTPWTIDVAAPNLTEAQAMAKRLAALPAVASARTLMDYVPADQEEKHEILAAASYFVTPVRTNRSESSPTEARDALAALADEAARAGQSTAASAASGRRLHAALERFLTGPAAGAEMSEAFARLRSNVVGSLPAQVNSLAAMLSPDYVRLEDLPVPLVEQMLAADGRARIEVIPREDLSDTAALQRFVDSVRKIAPEASGPAVWLIEWGRVTWTAMRRALLGGTLCMLVVLVLLWRSVRDPLLAFFPLVLMAVVTCAVLVLAGQSFNFANVIVLPMLLGMGVDNGVHLVHRHRTRPEEVDVLSTSTARAVFYAGLTTILSFGSLAFTSHRGMAAVGQLLALGVFFTLVCYVVVLPAVLEWDDRRRVRPGRLPGAK
jgi:hopanoid biosynthesis associated RND transporter like protein HpnN